jgi:hypothetical protein
MVGVINPNGTQTLDSQIRAARAADFQIAPGQAIPNEVSATLAAPSAGSSSTASAPTARLSKLSSGAIAGIVVGGFLFLSVLVGIFICYFLRRNTANNVLRDGGEVTQFQYPPAELPAKELSRSPSNDFRKF